MIGGWVIVPKLMYNVNDSIKVAFLSGISIVGKLKCIFTERI